MFWITEIKIPKSNLKNYNCLAIKRTNKINDYFCMKLRIKESEEYDYIFNFQNNQQY